MSHRLLRALPAALLALSIPATAAHAAGGRHAIPGSRPQWAAAARDQGDADSSQQVTINVYLPLTDVAGAQQLAQAVSDPSSAGYGQYLTPDQFRSRFAPTAQTVKAVETFLQGAGLQIGDVPDNNSTIEATGTLAQAEQAFAVNVHRYAWRGRLLKAPTGALSVPDSLASAIVAVRGLDDSGTLTRPLADSGDDAGPAPATAPPNAPVRAPKQGRNQPVPPPDAFVNAPPCSSYYGQNVATTLPKVNGKPAPYAPCGYTPNQFQGAYGTAGAIGNGNNGSGQTVAITDAYAAATILPDANQYAAAHGQQPFRRGQFSQLDPKKPYRYGYNDTVNGDLCGEQGWYGEETLDVEAVHAMAPGANVLYVPGRSCDDPDLLAALNKIVDKRLATIITNSWGDIGEDVDADTLQAYNNVFVQAAIEGIAVLYSSGDDGDDSLDTDDGSAAVDFPSSNPLVTSVGGTALAVGKNNQTQFETGWVSRSARTTRPSSRPAGRRARAR